MSDKKEECKQALMDLLIERNSLGSFIDNLVTNDGRYLGIHKGKVFDHYIATHNGIIGWVDKMSRWSDTPQGHDYWQRINEVFRTTVKDVFDGKSRTNRCKSIW